jgi:hypothetical protein
MTEAEQEAVLERAAIMEYDGGLDRRAATLAAFALRFPIDYQNMLERVKPYPDGETIIYEFLEGLLSSRPVQNTIPRKYAWQKETSPLPKRYEGMAALEYMAGQGIPLIGVRSITREDGKTIYPTINRKDIVGDYEAAFTADPAEIAALLEGKGDKQGRARGTRIERFYFIPKEAGFLCLDIDRKQGKTDGLQELYKVFPKDTLPRTLQDIERFFPCYVSTPSGGYHLYFKYSGPDIRITELCPGVEIKYGRPGITAPGSMKDGKPYIMYGNLESSHSLYGILINRIDYLQNQKRERAAADKPMPSRARRYTRITLDTLADEARDAYAGHHDRQVSFAGRASRCKFPYSETLYYVTASPGIFGNDPDTETTIKSVYQDNGAL